MALSPQNIVSITKARGNLGALAEKVSGENYIVLTKGSNPRAALVDVNYLEKLQETARRLYQKTFLSQKVLPYTRNFTNEEIEEWQKEDPLKE